jgi:hypothetical protein
VSKLQKILYGLLILSLGLSLSSAPAAATPPNETAAIKTQTEDIPENFELVGENNLFELYADQATLAFKVLDKRSGYIWHSNLDEKQDDDRLNRTWTAFALSGISIDFLDMKLNSSRASITSADHTILFTKSSQGFEAVLTFTEPSISMNVNVSLNENGVSVEVPFSSLKEENPEFRIESLYVYPFFGATRVNSTPGYMFVPDGSGTLIRFSETTKAKNQFYGRYYGPDFGMIGFLPYDPFVNRAYRISIPVIGMAHGEKENAFIAIVEKGASYGEFRAHPAGIITNFNFIYNTFIYNQSYFQATSRSGDGVTAFQPATNKFDVTIQYRFLTGEESDYVGMAKSYQKYLVEKGDLNKVAIQNNDIGIRLEFLAGDYERVLLWNRMVPMTTLGQMSEILKGLDIKNPEVIYYGWQPLGSSRMPPKTFKLDKTLGTRADLTSVMQEIQSNGGHLYLYLDPVAAYLDVPGYSTRSDLAMSIMNANIVSYNRNLVNFFRNVDSMKDFYPSISKDVFTDLKAGLALDGIGTNLYSDYKRGNFINREDTIQQYRTLLADNAGEIAFYNPNDYLFRYMQSYLDIPISDSGYIYTTDTVPFLQIVFAGYVPVYGTAFNFSSNFQEDMLRHVDFGVYPSFFLTHEATANILDTTANWIYTSSYEQWSSEVERTYQWINNFLGPVKGQEIIARDELARDVFATTYSNGKTIIVNYSNRPFQSGEILVNGKDAVLSEVQP